MNWDSFVEQVKGFGVANWILIGSVLAILILLIILVSVNIKIMGKYRKDMMKTRVARLVPKIEVIDGWCCLSVENKGQDIATNVKLKYEGSIIKYYNNYITKSRLDDVLRKTMGRGFMLVAGDKKTVRLFPIRTINNGISIMEKRTKITVARDLDFTGITEHKDEIEIAESFDEDDAKILKGVAKEEAKLLKLKSKQDKKYQKSESRLNLKRQKAIQKHNKKQGKATHTSVVTPPDMSRLIKDANLNIKMEYECLGYLMKYKFKYKNVDLAALPEELNTVRTVLSAQNAIMSEMVLLQNDIRAMLGEKLITAEDVQRIKGVNADLGTDDDFDPDAKKKTKKKVKKAKKTAPVVETEPIEEPAVMETQSAEEPQIVEEAQPIEEPAAMETESSVGEKILPVDDNPVGEKILPVDDNPVGEEILSADDTPVGEEILPVEDSILEETAIEEPIYTEDIPNEDEPLVLDEEPIYESVERDVEIPTDIESEVVAEDTPVEEVNFEEFILPEEELVEDTERE